MILFSSFPFLVVILIRLMLLSGGNSIIYSFGLAVTSHFGCNFILRGHSGLQVEYDPKLAL